jgi:predicted PurR-regulated permease PerM
MIELIPKMLESTQGTVLLFIIVIALFFIVYPLIRFLIKKLKDMKSLGKNGVEFETSVDGKVSVSSNQNGTGQVIRLPLNVYKMIIEAFNSTFVEYSTSMSKVKSDHKAEITEKLEDCIEAAIGSIVLSYNNVNSKDQNSDVRFLQLYLESEFGKIFREDLEKIRDNQKLSKWSDAESTDALNNVVKSILNKMKRQIMPWVSVSFGQSLSDLIPSLDHSIRETISPTIQSFVRLSKEEQDSLLKLDKERQDMVESKLKNFLETI